MSRTTRVKAKYSLFDTSAAADGALAMPAVQPFSDFEELLDEEQTIAKWLTLEDDSCALDGSYEIFPDEIESVFTGVWSDTLSGSDGAFAVPPVLTADFSNAHTTGGITLVFAAASGDWCSDLTVDWYGSDGTLLATADYQPNRAEYFCEQQVEDFYQLRITFRKTNKPFHFLKLTGIRYGVSMELGGDMLVACSVLEEVDPVSAEVGVNTLRLQFRTDKGEFDLLDLTGAYVLFQQRQRVDVTGEIDGVQRNVGSFYLDTPTTSDNLVTLDCIDLVGTMDDTTYLGGYWPDGIPAGELLAEIMQSAGIGTDMYEIDAALQQITVTGYLAIQTHREALQQVAFAIGAAVDCCRSEVIKIRQLDSSAPKTVPSGRKVVGHTQTQDALVTGVEVYTHNYALGNTTGELFREERQAGEYLVQFSSPAANLSASGAAITQSGVNYARILVAAAGEVTISGCTYEDTQSLAGSVYMEQLPANAKVNIKTVTDCTLNADAQALAQRVYDHAQRRITDSGQIILADEQAGDLLAVQNADGKTLVGVAEQISIDLTGGFIAKVVTHGTGQSDI